MPDHGRRNQRFSRRLALASGVGIVGALSHHDQSYGATPLESCGFTHIRADGNRFVDGKSTFPDVRTQTIDLPGTPNWVVSAARPNTDTTFWVVQLDDGTTIGFALDIDLRFEQVDIAGSTAGPPVIADAGDPTRLLTVPPEFDPSPFSAPATNGRSTVFVDTAGRLQLLRGGDLVTLDQHVLIDTRTVVDDVSRYLALAGLNNERYRHGVIGDDEEATSFDIFDEVEFTRIGLRTPDVIESNIAIWFDLDDDGAREIIVPVSNGEDGARIVAFREDGTPLAEGTGFGRPLRWRQPLAVGPFGPAGETEIAVVRTPHIGGVVEFYRQEEDRVTIAAELEGFSSHVLGSRNLDMGIAGDFDGDGQPELVVPSQDRTRIAGIVHLDDSMAVERWSLDLPGSLKTNLSAIQAGESLHLAAGSDDGTLSIWAPA